jgi:hypothetical protein
MSLLQTTVSIMKEDGVAWTHCDILWVVGDTGTCINNIDNLFS